MNASVLPKTERPHRRLVPTLIAVATVIGFFACFAVWVNRQVLSTSNWVKTSSRVIADPKVESALSVYLVNELFKNVNVEERVESALPGQLKGLSGPLSAGLRQIADQAVPKLLATPQVQLLWINANRTAHDQLMRILNGGGKAVSTENGEVALNLRQLVTELGSQLGISSQVNSAREKLNSAEGLAAKGAAEKKLGIVLPTSAGKIVIMRSSELKTAQDIVKGVKGLAILLPLLALALFALAVWLAHGWRRYALRTTGWCLFGIGVALLLLRRVGEQQVVNNLVAVQANRPAAEDVWSIATTLLYDIAIAMVLYGLFVVFSAWIAGQTRPARALRHVAAPWLREHPGSAYAAAGVLLLLIVFWGPTPATRQILPVLGFALLFALGVTALRRQTALEFPDATPGHALEEIRGWWPFGRHHPPADPAVRDPDGLPPQETAAPPSRGG